MRTRICGSIVYVRQNGVNHTPVVASNTAPCDARTACDVCGQNADKPKRRQSAQQDWQPRSAWTATGQWHQTAKLLFCICLSAFVYLVIYVRLYSALCNVPLIRSDTDHTVLPANYTMPAFTPQLQATPPLGWYSFYHPTEGRRLSWPGWLVTYRNKVPSPGVEIGHCHPSQY